MKNKRHCAWLLLLFSWQCVFASGNELNLETAEMLALQKDPLVRAIENNAAAYAEKEIAAGSLPDPVVKLGAANFPTDTFKRDQEPMTQLQIGVRQMFPRGDSLDIQSRKAGSMSRRELEHKTTRERMVLKSVRDNWLEVFYWVKARQLLAKTRSLFDELVNITEGQYAAGRRNQQDYIRAQLELGMLDDRDLNYQTEEEVQRSMLARWIGPEYARLPMPEAFHFETPENFNEKYLESNPEIRAAEKAVEIEQENVNLARQAFKPGWGLDVTYGFRDGVNPDGSERADFLSAMVTFDLPLFTGNRQDRNLNASNLKLKAAHYQLDEKRLQVSEQLDKNMSRNDQLGKRIQHFKKVLLPRAHENADAALSAYQADRGDFSALVRARITELETELKLLRLKTDQAKVQTQLKFILGEAK